ncbi:uncharacterized protein LOC134542860 isoform X2 [Bacillus rossius redtenbacheri]
MFDDYYNGCCNGTFWPLFHSMPDRAVFKSETWKAYCDVNAQFATHTLQALRAVVKDLDACGKYDTHPVVWIHDYQLFVAATTIRQVLEEEKLRAKLSFFLHIPFPSWDIMRLFPWDDEILQGMLACDMVGFHVEDYCLNFIDCCSRRLGCRVDRSKMLVEIAGRTVHVKALPIGIPFDRFQELAETTPKFLKISDQEKIVLGVDRLDYTKGLVHRVLAFERLLERHPEYVEKLTLLQICVPSRTDVREYQQLKEDMDQLVGRVNGRFSRPNWSPIRYIYGNVSQQQLAAFYRDSAVALVTPLRDGMNLVAKEYVACQIGEPGVLVLSPFAGAGGMMHEALLINPYELNEVANTLHRALQMPLDERQLRMKHLRQREKLMDVNCWMNSFLATMGAIESPDDDDPLSNQMSLTLDDFDLYLSSHIDDECKLSLILDYDGTLAHLTSHPDLAIMPAETRRVLERLSSMHDVSVAIISGRGLENVKKMAAIENVTYAGSHGIEILHPDGTRFVHPVPFEYSEKLKELAQVLAREVGRDGAWVEQKGVVLTFHYRETPPDRREAIVRRARQLFDEAGFEPHQSHMALETRPPVRWDQGRACLHILRTTFGADWSERVRVVYAGNEGAMMALQGIACTFRVDSSPVVRTAANFRLAGPDAVLTMLRWIEKEMGKRAPRLPRSPRAAHRSPRMHKKGSDSLRILETELAFDDHGEDVILPARRSPKCCGSPKQNHVLLPRLLSDEAV